MARYFLYAGIVLLSVCTLHRLVARENNLLAKGRIGYFYLTSELMHRQYRHGGADYEIELQSRFYNDLAFWFNINIFRRDSKEIGFCDPLSLHVYPVSGGFIYPLTPDALISPYLGIGASYSFIAVTGSDGKKKELHHQQWGCVGKSGLLVYCSDSAYFDLFADYYYTRASAQGAAPKGASPQGVTPNSFEPRVGGLRIGLGFGINY